MKVKGVIMVILYIARFQYKLYDSLLCIYPVYYINSQVILMFCHN